MLGKDKQSILLDPFVNYVKMNCSEQAQSVVKLYGGNSFCPVVSQSVLSCQAFARYDPKGTADLMQCKNKHREGSSEKVDRKFKKIIHCLLIISCHSKLECLSPSVTFNHLLYFVVRAEPTQVDRHTVLHSNCRLLPFPTNIRLG